MRTPKRTEAEIQASIDYWQAQGPTRILEAAWQMVVDHEKARGISEDQLKLQRNVARFVRRRRLTA
jgi:hypothetical protein